MRNQYVLKHKEVGFYLLGLVFIAVTSVAFLTHWFSAGPTNNPIISFAVGYHTSIMALLVLVSVAFGYFWATVLYKEIENRTKTSKNMLDLILLFLGSNEKKIIKYLVEENGKTTQANISRLEGMDKVKSFRSLQKLQEKDIIKITPHGKVRNIELKDEILEILKEKTN